MTTGMMTRMNISLTEINDMEFHDFQNRYKTLMEMMRANTTPIG